MAILLPIKGKRTSGKRFWTMRKNFTQAACWQQAMEAVPISAWRAGWQMLLADFCWKSMGKQLEKSQGVEQALKK